MECTSDLCVIGGKIGIGTDSPAQKLSVNGIIETTSGGVKFPDGTIQTTKTLAGATGATGPAGSCSTTSLSCVDVVVSAFNAVATCASGYTLTGCSGGMNSYNGDTHQVSGSGNSCSCGYSGSGSYGCTARARCCKLI
jgi:hypothetical protein